MIKKQIFGRVLIIPFMLLFFVSFGQVFTYEDMPKKVKDQMDLNKIKGLPVWEDVLFTFHVTVTGLEKEERQVLMERASQKAEIISVNFEDDRHVIVECQGGTNFDRVKSIFSSLVSNITGIENIGSIKSTGKK